MSDLVGNIEDRFSLLFRKLNSLEINYVSIKDQINLAALCPLNDKMQMFAIPIVLDLYRQ